MFAVVKTGGKQYKVSAGDVLTVERLKGDVGQAINFSSVLLINQEGNLSVGAPFIENAEVQATIVEQARGEKIIVFKKKRRQGYRRTAGHRQELTVLRIEDIIYQNKSSKDIKKSTVAEKTPSIESKSAEKIQKVNSKEAEKSSEKATQEQEKKSASKAPKSSNEKSEVKEIKKTSKTTSEKKKKTTT